MSTPVLSPPQMEQTPTPVPVLEFQQVTSRPLRRHDIGLEAVTFTLHAGELMLIKMELGNARSPLPILAQGLGTLDSGVVLFEQRDWKQMSFPENEQRRGRIGRVYEQPAWVSNLTVAANLFVAQSHLTRTPLPELEKAATEWANRFGLKELPDRRPAHFENRLLRRLQWVRAFYHRPKLLLLERPMYGIAHSFLPALIDAVLELCSQGTAVVWLTINENVWSHARLEKACRFSFEENQLHPDKEVKS